MIVNPIVAAAAVAARAVGTIFPGNWPARRPNHSRHEPSSSREAFPANQYFMDMEDDINHQSKELENFMATPPIPIQDAEILTKETNQSQDQRGTRPPPLPGTNNPFRLLGLEPGADFDAIRRAYREMAKIYHPDVVAGPDSSPDERKEANWDFARINSAFDILKRKENEQVFEYDVYIDGERVTKSVAVTEEYLQNDPYRISYDRIREMAEYRKRRPQKRTWYEGDPYYHPGHQGFGADESYSVDAYSKGNWRTMRNYDERNANYNPSNSGFGPIPSNERMWEERQIVEQEKARRGVGFGVNPHQDQWWNERSAFDYEPPRSNYAHQPRDNQRADAEIKQGYPYKDMLWNKRTSCDEDPYRPYYPRDYDYDAQERFHVKEKWWKADDPTIGDFSP
mmetsp:Transcript_38466/g.92702  ORF Transcript_38466/g.92702 Transcript_38466/m.92702 type:complete len:396 (+) Transcript_38466:71-1258(+)